MAIGQALGKVYRAGSVLPRGEGVVFFKNAIFIAFSSVFRQFRENSYLTLSITIRIFVMLAKVRHTFDQRSWLFSIAILDTEPQKILTMEAIFKDLFAIKDDFLSR